MSVCQHGDLGLCPGVLCPVGGVLSRGYLAGGLCPRGSLSRGYMSGGEGFCPGGSLSEGVSVQDVSVKEFSVWGHSLDKDPPAGVDPGFAKTGEGAAS